MRVPTKNYLYEYDVSHKFFYLKLINYLKAHTFVTFHCFVQFFLRRKYSSVSSLTLEYITLLYIVNKLPLCSQYYFETICLQWSFQKKTISSLKMIRKKKGGLRIKFRKSIHRKTDSHIRKKTFEAF